MMRACAGIRACDEGRTDEKRNGGSLVSLARARRARPDYSSSGQEDTIIFPFGWLLGSRGFAGGAYLPMDVVGDDPILTVPPPSRLHVPLTLVRGRPVRPAVEVGQPVEVGQLLGRPESTGAVSVLAPLAGRVVARGQVDTACGSDLPAVLIEPSSHPSARAAARSGSPLPYAGGALPAEDDPANPVNRWATKRLEAFGLDALAEACDSCGLACDPVRGLGLGWMIQEARRLGVRDLIVNGLQPEPRCTANERVLRANLEGVLAAGLILKSTLAARRLMMAVDEGDRWWIQRVRRAALGTPVRVVALVNKYPQSSPLLLCRTLTGREVAPGGTTLQAGSLIVSAETLADLWWVLQERRPVTHRTIAVTGPAALRPGHYRVPVGMSFADVLAAVGLARPLVRLVDGGPLTGRSVESLAAVVSAATSTLLLIDRDHDPVPAPGPCIRCGACQEDCPAGLDPQRLLEAYEVGRPAQAAALAPAACMECGLCSYVCPTELPLADAAIRLKRAAFEEMHGEPGAEQT